MRINHTTIIFFTYSHKNKKNTMKRVRTISLFGLLLSIIPSRPLVSAQSSCENAVSIDSFPFTATGNTADNTVAVQAGGSCNLIFEGITRGDWYELVGNGNCILLDATQSSFIPYVAFYKGSNCTSMSCIQEGLGYQPELQTEADQIYRVLVTGYQSGDYVIKFEVSTITVCTTCVHDVFLMLVFTLTTFEGDRRMRNANKVFSLP